MVRSRAAARSLHRLVVEGEVQPHPPCRGPRQRRSSRPIDPSAATISALGEHALIERMMAALASHNKAPSDGPWRAIHGVGDDDAATLLPHDGPYALVMTADAMALDTHFRATTAPEDIAWRLVASNVSDIAACGATPSVATITFAAPPDLSADFALRLYDGLGAAASQMGLRIVGGDTIRAASVVLSLALTGYRPVDAPIPARSNARPGDVLVVSGHPGESGAGFLLTEGRGASVPQEIAARLRARFLRPVPRVTLGIALAGLVERLAMIDVSDGVLNDAGQIARASGVGVEVSRDKLPISDDLRLAATLLGKDAVDLALTGGEDYELLAAMSPDSWHSLPDVLRREMTAIGRVVDGRGVKVIEADGSEVPSPIMFSHFA